jgi:hypothetical protein
MAETIAMNDGGNDNHVYQLAITTLPLSRYCELYHENKPAVMKRIQRDHWQHGTHVFKPPGSKELWVCLAAVDAWAMSKSA